MKTRDEKSGEDDVVKVICHEHSKNMIQFEERRGKENAVPKRGVGLAII